MSEQEMTFGGPQAGPDVDALVAKHFGGSEETVATEEPAPAAEPVAEEGKEAPAEEVAETTEPVVETSDDFLNKVREESNRLSNQDKMKQKLNGLSKFENIDDLFKTDPLAALEQLGFSTNDINNALANKHAGDSEGASSEEDKPAEGKSDIEKRMEAFEKAQEEREFNDMVNTLDTNVNQLVASNEKYELIKQYGMHEEVTNFILEVGQQGQDITYEKACDLVEAQLEKQVFGNYDKMKETNKYKNKYQSEQKSEVNIKKPSEKAKPITNDTASQIGSEQTTTFEKDSPEYYNDLVKRHGL